MNGNGLTANLNPFSSTAPAAPAVNPFGNVIQPQTVQPQPNVVAHPNIYASDHGAGSGGFHTPVQPSYPIAAASQQTTPSSYYTSNVQPAVSIAQQSNPPTHFFNPKPNPAGPGVSSHSSNVYGGSSNVNPDYHRTVGYSSSTPAKIESGGYGGVSSIKMDGSYGGGGPPNSYDNQTPSRIVLIKNVGYCENDIINIADCNLTI